MIGNIYKLKEDGTPWQIVAEGVFAKGPQDVWPEVVVMQLLEPPYPIVVMDKGDDRWKKMEVMREGELVRIAADRRWEKRQEQMGKSYGSNQDSGS